MACSVLTSAYAREQLSGTCCSRGTAAPLPYLWWCLAASMQQLGRAAQLRCMVVAAVTVAQRHVQAWSAARHARTMRPACGTLYAQNDPAPPSTIQPIVPAWWHLVYVTLAQHDTMCNGSEHTVTPHLPAPSSPSCPAATLLHRCSCHHHHHLRPKATGSVPAMQTPIAGMTTSPAPSWDVAALASPTRPSERTQAKPLLSRSGLSGSGLGNALLV